MGARDPRKKQVVICDDHAIVRAALEAVFEAESSFEVAAFASNGKQLVATVTALVPDLVILDIEMPKWDGIVAIQHLLDIHPELRILVFSAHEKPELIRLVSESGAAGFIGKSESASAILPVATAVLDGGRWFPDWLNDDSVDGAGPKRTSETDELRRLRSLTSRERAVLDLYASGLRTNVVAKQLGVQPATVYTHVRNAVHKLNVSSRTQAVVIAARYDYLSNDPDASDSP